MARYIVRYKIVGTDGQTSPTLELHDDFDVPYVAMMPGLVGRLVSRRTNLAVGDQVTVLSVSEVAS